VLVVVGVSGHRVLVCFAFIFVLVEALLVTDTYGTAGQWGDVGRGRRCDLRFVGTGGLFDWAGVLGAGVAGVGV